MKKNICLLALFCFTGIAHADETLYVQSVMAKILSEPRFGSQTIGLANRGDTLVALTREGEWYRIKQGDEIGFVAALLVGKQPPGDRKRAVKADADIGKRARRRASAVATAGATRGLTADDRKRASQNGVADYSALAFMDEAAVTEEEAADFLKMGMEK